MSRNFKFKELAEWLVQLPAGCVVGMEACSSAHYWGRRMQAMGLQSHLMAAEFVQAFRKSKSAKNDHNDAEAIAIAVRQPTMHFVAIKNEAQQSRLAWHRVREGWKEERTALINRCRGLLLEFGYPIARSAAAFQRGLKTSLQEETLPQTCTACWCRLSLNSSSWICNWPSVTGRLHSLHGRMKRLFVCVLSWVSARLRPMRCVRV